MGYFKLITGKAGAGKTSRIAKSISDAVNSGKGGSYLLVPELFSYEAQRELCRICGDKLSLYAAVTTFTELSRQVSSELGQLSKPYMDDGGRILCMSLALRQLQKTDSLRYFRNIPLGCDICEMFINAIDEMKQSAISSSDLVAAFPLFEESLANKLFDLSIVCEKYNEIVSSGHLDPSDRLSILAEQIEFSSFDENSTFYIDGFTGFTAEEYNVLKALLKKGVNMVVCLTLDRVDDTSEYYAVARSTAHKLKAMAEQLSLTYTAERYVSDTREPVMHYTLCSGMQEECEYAAVKTLELIRDTGCRYRDIAIAVRGFDSYQSVLESTFDRFSIPLFTARKESILSHPLCVFISCAYDVIRSGFAPDDVIALLGTGLTDLTDEQTDMLCEYVFRWNLREGNWRQGRDWLSHPDGYNQKDSSETALILEKINSNRHTAGDALISFTDSCASAVSVSDHALALYNLLENMHVSRHLDDKDASVWNICIESLEQMNSILGEKEITIDDFSRLYLMMLSKNSIGSIPDSADSVSAGDYDRMRRRHIRYLIVLGASEDRLPPVRDSNGLFTIDELEELSDSDLQFGGDFEENLFREFSLIYNCFSLPSDDLFFAYSGRASYIISRKSKDAEQKYVPLRPLDIQPVSRGTLSESAVKALYGSDIRISPSKAEKFYSCKYSFFCEYGLRAKPFKEASFTSAEIGTYIHYVLEHVAGDVASAGGFRSVSDDELTALTRKYTDIYIHDRLNDFSEENDRFVFLFKRIADDTCSIVLDMANELRKSDFFPIEFELNFSDRDKFAPLSINNGLDSLFMSGVADRVDEWMNDGKRFIRIVDYKTGKKKFSLSDIWHGMSMQMLLYLYILSVNGNSDIVPAGVMYIPANNRYISLKTASDAENAEKERVKAHRRSGIVLDSYGVPEAWENGSDKTFEPANSKMTSEQFDLLSKHIIVRLGEMAREVREGQICADPCRKGSDNSACAFCDYNGSCGFSDGKNGESMRTLATLSNDKVWENIEKEVSGIE